MKIDSFALLLLTILVVALFFAMRKMIQDAVIKAKKQEDDVQALNRHIASQTFGSLVCSVSVFALLLCSVLTWWQILLSVSIAAVVVALVLLCFKKKSNP